MPSVHESQLLTFRVRFSAAVTGTPTAQIFLEGVSTGAPINGAGAGAVWLFYVTVPVSSIGDMIEVETTAVVAAVNEYQTILREIVGAGLSVQDTEQLRYRLGLNGETEQPVDPTPTPIVVPPNGSGIRSNGGLLCVDADGDPEPDVVFNIEWIKGPNIDGYSFTPSPITATSDIDGELLVTGLYRNGQYMITRAGSSLRGVFFTVPNESSFLLPEVV